MINCLLYKQAVFCCGAVHNHNLHNIMLIAILTKYSVRCMLLKDKKIPYCYHLLFRVVEIQRIYEATATPDFRKVPA